MLQHKEGEDPKLDEGEANLGVEETAEAEDDKSEAEAEQDEDGGEPAQPEVRGDNPGGPDEEQQQQDQQQDVSSPPQGPG